MKKTVAIVSYDECAGQFYGSQIKELFDSYVEVHVYSTQSGTIKNIQPSDLYLVSTDAFDSAEECGFYISAESNIVDIYTTFNKDIIRQLILIPKGTKAMLVNLSYKMTREVIASLSSLGINQIEFHSVYPGLKNIPDLDFAITPAETRYVPKNVKKILDLGQRVLSTSTIVETALKLNLDFILEEEKFQNYFDSIATSSYSFNRLLNRSATMESWFEILLSILDKGIIGINSEGIIFSCNEKAQQIVGLRSEDLVGHSQKAVLPYLPFEDCRETKVSVPSKIIRINRADVIMSLTPVIRNQKFLGGFAQLAFFNEEEAKQNQTRVQLLNKGHKAKYKFEDIIGENKAMKHAIVLAQKMSKTNSTVLITGESGTGKELFAHAIHNASPRKACQFIAINCAAMPENLLESELFGYEEGAFTGARKGGKLGYFEFAHKGTIFLDEIEGMSPSLQIKLLRVLQEKEVLRLGGNMVIPVDVRIIAATNERLEQLVQNGNFRKDLYYRLNVLQINIPPLRERREDVLLILESMKRELGGYFRLTDESKQILLNHTWEGNARELRNYVEYFISLEQDIITPEDLPEGLKVHKKSTTAVSQPAQVFEIKDKSVFEEYPFLKENPLEYRFLLEQLAGAFQECRPAGRRSLSATAQLQGIYLSEQVIKAMLAKLNKSGFVNSSKGRGGTRITEVGKQILNRF